MSYILLIFGYVPLLLVIATFIYGKWLRKKSGTAAPVRKMDPVCNKGKDYPVLSMPLPEAHRLLEEGDDNLHDVEMQELKDRLCSLMEREQLYLNPDIRVGDVAERLFTNKSYLSQAIKLKANKNFCQLVHYYRVRDAMKLFSEDPSLTIQQLCNRVGFNSMTTFNAAFSRNTGYTPAEWCREYRKRNERQDQD